MIDQIRRKLERAEAEHAFAQKQLEEEERQLTTLRTDLENALAAQKVVQEAACAVQEAAHSRIASVVSRCLKAVFGDDCYEFVITFERKRGRTEAALSLRKDGMELTEPMEEVGGGVIDVAALALRVACLLSTVPRSRLLLVLDEPLKHLSASCRPAARVLLETLAEELGIQIIMVTHSNALKIGNVIELG